jgi:hypothetical protein
MQLYYTAMYEAADVAERGDPCVSLRHHLQSIHLIQWF